jgi:hypothetical protein
VVRQVTRGHVLNWTAMAYDLAYASGEGLLSDLSIVQTTFDKLGRSSGYSYQYLRHAEDYTGEADDPVNFTHTYGLKYQGRDGYLEKQVWGHSTNPNFRASTSESVYDGWGRRIAIREHTPLPKSIGTLQDRVRYFSYDADGMILRRREGILNANNAFEQSAEALKKDELVAYANGQQVAKQTRGGNLELRTKLAAYQEAGRSQSSAKGLKLGYGDFLAGAMGKYGAATGRGVALEDAVTRLTDYSTGSLGMSSVPVNSGDTLQSIAQRVYGNSGLWYVLAEANAISNAELVPGTSLRVPSVRVSANDASTFKPYNPGEIVGSTAPGMPYIEKPEAGNNCAMMVVMIVAIVVVAVVAPYLAPNLSNVGGAGLLGGAALGTGALASVTLGGAIAAGFIAGAAASIASQVVGKALGVVDHFSLKDAFVNGVVTAATFGFGQAAIAGRLGTLLESSKWARAAATAVVNSTASTVGNKLVSRPSNFSWKSVAASAVSSAIATGISDGLGLNPQVEGIPASSGQFGNDLASGLIQGLVSAHVNKAFGVQDKIDYRKVAMDAFGNALGNAAARGINFLIDLHRLSPEQRAYYDELRRDKGNRWSRTVDLHNAQRLDQIRSNTDAFLRSLSPGQNQISLESQAEIISDAQQILESARTSGTPIKPAGFMEVVSGLRSYEGFGDLADQLETEKNWGPLARMLGQAGLTQGQANVLGYFTHLGNSKFGALTRAGVVAPPNTLDEQEQALWHDTLWRPFHTALQSQLGHADLMVTVSQDLAEEQRLESNIDRSWHFDEGPTVRMTRSLADGMYDSSLPAWQRALSGAGFVLSGPGAALEEFGRGILNAPYYASVTGQSAAAAAQARSDSVRSHFRWQAAGNGALAILNANPAVGVASLRANVSRAIGARLPGLISSLRRTNPAITGTIGSSADEIASNAVRERVLANGVANAERSAVGTVGGEVPYFVRRGDSRGPEIIFNEGFRARGTSEDLYLHALDNTNPPSMYVATSKSEAVAIEFGTQYFQESGFYYTIRPSADALDVNQILGTTRSPHWSEMEVAIPHSVVPSDIRAVTPLNSDGTYVGYSVLNPYWRP